MYGSDFMPNFGKPIKAVFYFKDSENNERELALIIEEIDDIELEFENSYDFYDTKNASISFHTISIEKLDF